MIWRKRSLAWSVGQPEDLYCRFVLVVRVYYVVISVDSYILYLIYHEHYSEGACQLYD